MSYYIIIRGPLGIGKSTIAKRLSEILHAEYVPIDAVLEKHDLDKIDKESGCIPAENFIKADEIVLPEIKNKLEKGKKVIFDACFYHKEHIEHLIQNLPYRHYIFTLKAPLEVCIQRDSKRNKTHGRDAARVVHYLVSRAGYVTNNFIINTEKKTIEQTIKEILSHLSKK